MFKADRILDSLNEMLDNAISGNDIENSYDESKLSAIEGKMHKFLMANGRHKEQLEQQQQMINSLISDISHQTKTPISNISLYSELIAECGDDAQRDSYSKLLINQAEKLSFLVDCLVKTSRLECGIIKPVPKLQPVDLLVDNVKKSFAELSVARSDAKARYDLRWTAEAVLNIVDNAYKYGAKRVEIAVTAYNMFVRVDVKDNGVGIAEQDIPSIFKRFYRGKDTAEVEGVGLGLYLTRQIISVQGGYIKVSSQPGEGTVFSVFLAGE